MLPKFSLRSGENSLAVFAAAYAGSAVLQKGVGFILFLWLSHALSIDSYAEFGLLLALQAGLSTLASVGIVETVIGQLRNYGSAVSRRELFTGSNAVFLALALLVSLGAMVFYAVLFRTKAWSPGELGVVVLGGLLTAFFTVKSGLVRLNEEHAASVALVSLPPLAGFVLGFAAFVVYGSIYSYFAGMAAGLLGSALVAAAVKPDLFALPRHLQEARILASSLPMFVLVGVLLWAIGYGNTYIVDLFFAKADVAQFTFAYTLSSIMQLVSTALNQVWAPRFFSRVHTLKVEELERENRRFFALHGAILGLVGAVLLIAIPIATHAVGGNLANYGHMPGKFFFLFAAYAFCLPWYHTTNYFLAHGRGASLMKVTITSAVIGLALLSVVISLFGVLGIYIGFMIQMAVRSGVALLWARREWRLHVFYEGIVIAILLMGAATLLSLWLS